MALIPIAEVEHLEPGFELQGAKMVEMGRFSGAKDYCLIWVIDKRVGDENEVKSDGVATYGSMSRLCVVKRRRMYGALILAMGRLKQELRDNTFSGSDHEDANEHIEKVLEIVDLFHNPNITQDQVMLRAFPMYLTGAMSRWLRNKPSGSITTWEDLKTKFLSKYYPPTRTTKKMEEINNFQQEPDETLYQA
ncbi:hypothetical protein Tco_0205014 [Tanacetum coccineum]